MYASARLSSYLLQTVRARRGREAPRRLAISAIEAMGILGIKAGAAGLTRLARARHAALVVGKYLWKALSARRRAPQL